MLTAERLRELLHYAPDTGIFVWRRQSGRSRAGDIAGTPHSHGYRTITVEGTRSYAHRLAWLYMTGEWPEMHIDHINGDSSDARFSNLRQATRFQNLRNCKVSSNNKVGLKGVSRRGNKWRAVIYLNRRQTELGLFDSPQDAHDAYVATAQQYFGEFARAS